MASTRRISSLIAVAVGVLLLPAATNAVVYCVPNDTVDPSCDAGQGKATIQDALTAAQGTGAVADTVHIDAGSYNEGPLTYIGASANVLNLEGEGTGQTLLTMPSTVGTPTGLSINAPTGSTVSNLAMTIPAPADTGGDRGIDLAAGALGHDLFVDGPLATNAIGVRLFNTASLQDATVNLPFASPSNGAVLGNGASTSIERSTLHANTAIRNIGTATLTAERSSIQASRAGANLDQGTLIIRNSLIDLGTSNGAVGVQPVNLNNGANPMNAVVDGVTIIGGGTNSIGIQVQADSALNPPDEPADNAHDGEDSTATVSNTVISGPATSLKVEADRGETATLTTSYSNYDSSSKVVTNDLTAGGGLGTANVTETNQTNLAPGFVGGGNFHLAPGSALIDIGDPAAPPGGALDFDGDARALDGLFDCVSLARRDIGFDEFVGPGLQDCTVPDTIAPDTSVSGKSKVKTRKKKARVAWTLNSTEPGSTFQCSLDGAQFVPCTSPFTVKLRKGAHTLTVRAIDLAGNQDTTPAKFTTRVKRKK